MNSPLRYLVLSCALVAIPCAVRADDQKQQAAAEQQATAENAATRFFSEKVLPLLESRCFECHGPDTKKLKGGLRMHSRESLLNGGETGPALVPGKPDESLLISAVRYEEFEMPPRSRLPEGEIAILTRWVKEGALWPENVKLTVDMTKPEPFPLEERKASHWSWQQLQRRPAPQTKDVSWPRSDIDRFILAGLEAAEIPLAPEADRRLLIRRAYFDLIGLPPTTDEVRSFVNDPAETDTAFAKVVDRLLASEHFGERWARHWLDLVRFAETLGHEFDYPLHHAFEYRDYVIRAFNADVPYDQFVREHIAGDLLNPPRRHPTEGFNESLIATGFWFLGEDKHAPVDVKGEEAARIDNQLDVFSKAFLGLTVACARCHDHKFDAISTNDYYALSGFLQSSRRQIGLLDPHQRIQSGVEELLAARHEVEQLATRAERSLTGDKLGELLLATRPDADGKPDEKPADPQISRLREVLKSDAASQLDHPLALWRLLVLDDGGSFVERRNALQQRLQNEKQNATARLAESEPFADFRNGIPDGWFVTGHAFTPSSVAEQLVQRSGRVPGSLPGLCVDSGALSHRLNGVLRSPTFTLEHPSILYRVAGTGTEIRLIIDGYVMNEFNGLLFNDAKFGLATKGQMIWRRQAGDVGRYPGHRCHIEIIDNGDGWVAIEQIRFSKPGAEPLREPDPLTEALLARDDLSSPEQLAEAIGQVWADARQPSQNHSAELVRPLNNLLLAQRVCVSVEHQQQLQQLDDRMAAIDKRLPEPKRVIAITDGTGEDEHVFIRGSHKNPGEPVPRRFLTAISGEEQAPLTQGSGRLELANRLLAPTNPYPARVLANRVWRHLLGRGIVDSPDNFGVLGKEVTHPELLDYLALRLIDQGWSLKSLVREIVLSATYRMSSDAAEAADAADPQNLLWHRRFVPRLEGEAIRDSMLLISGRLDRKQFGPGVPVHLTPFMQGRGRPKKRTTGR